MAYGFTRTLPAITGSHPDFPVLLTAGSMPIAATDGGVNSVDNGGGNLRAYTDDTKTTQLPLEVVSFVTGGTPDVQVWVKATAVTSGAIYLEADSVATSQPAVTDTYGRNAVWSNDLRCFHAVDNSTTQVDSTGSFDGTISGVALTSLNPAFGGSNLDLNGVAYIDSGADPFGGSGYLVLRGWIKDAISSEIGVVGSWLNNSDLSSTLFIRSSGQLVMRSRIGSSNTDAVSSVGAVTANLWTWVAGIYDGTGFRVLVNDTQYTKSNKTGSLDSTSASLHIGKSGNLSGTEGSNTQEIRASNNTNVSLDYILTEYANQSDPVNWGTSSAWVDNGGSPLVTQNKLNQSQTITQVTLTQHSTISINGITQAQTSDQITMQQSGILSVNNLDTIQTVEQINLTQAHIISIADADQQQSVDQVQLLITGLLSLSDIGQQQSVEQVILSAINGSAVSINNASQQQSIDQISLSQLNVVSVDSLSQSQLLESINFNGVIVGYLKGALTIISAYNGSIDINSPLKGQIKLTNPLTGEIRIL